MKIQWMEQNSEFDDKLLVWDLCQNDAEYIYINQIES